MVRVSKKGGEKNNLITLAVAYGPLIYIKMNSEFQIQEGIRKYKLELTKFREMEEFELNFKAEKKSKTVMVELYKFH